MARPNERGRASHSAAPRKTDIDTARGIKEPKHGQGPFSHLDDLEAVAEWRDDLSARAARLDLLRHFGDMEKAVAEQKQLEAAVAAFRVVTRNLAASIAYRAEAS